MNQPPQNPQFYPHSNNRRYYERIVEELLRAIRGNQTQKEYSRKVGLSASVVSRWETGQIELKWTSFCELCTTLSIDLWSAMTFVGLRADDTSAPSLLRHILSPQSVRQWSQELGVPLSRLNRWASGATDPAVADIFWLTDYTTNRLPQFIARLTEITQIPLLSERYQTYLAASAAFAADPWSAAAHLALYLKRKSQDGHWTTGSLAQRLKLPVEQMTAILTTLETIGLVQQRDGVFTPHDVNIATNASNTTTRQHEQKIKAFWLRFAADSCESGENQPTAGYQIYPASPAKIEKIERLQREFSRRLFKILEDSEANEEMNTLRVTGQFSVTL